MLKKEDLDSIKTYRALPCSLQSGEINSVWLDIDDFGETKDTHDLFIDDDDLARWGCSNMHFIPSKEVNQEALKKYNITEEEFRIIQDKLECVLDVGTCGWCI